LRPPTESIGSDGRPFQQQRCMEVVFMVNKKKTEEQKK